MYILGQENNAANINVVDKGQDLVVRADDRVDPWSSLYVQAIITGIYNTMVGTDPLVRNK